MSFELIGILLIGAIAAYPLRFVWIVFTKFEGEAASSFAAGIKRIATSGVRYLRNLFKMFSRTERIAKKVSDSIDADYAWEAAWAQYVALGNSYRRVEQYPGNG